MLSSIEEDKKRLVKEYIAKSEQLKEMKYALDILNKYVNLIQVIDVSEKTVNDLYVFEILGNDIYNNKVNLKLTYPTKINKGDFLIPLDTYTSFKKVSDYEIWVREDVTKVRENLAIVNGYGVVFNDLKETLNNVID